MSHLVDLTNAMRYAQNASKEQYSVFIDSMIRMAS